MNASCSKSSMRRRYDSGVPLRAVFFDVGDTLVQHWKPQDEISALMREALRREFGERDWYEAFLGASIAPTHRQDAPEALRQETNRWYAEWFRNSRIGVDDIDIDRLRSTVTVPLDLVGSLVPGAPEALRWCKAHGLTVALVTNTLSRGDEEGAAGGGPDPLPVPPHLLVPAGERVRHERDGQAVRLAPAERFRRARNERADEIERNRDGTAQSIDVDIVDTDPAVTEPLRVPAVCLLPERLRGIVPVGWRDVRAEEGFVPVPLAELSPQGLLHESRDLVLGLPVLHEGVAHVEEHGAEGHAAIVSAPHAGLRAARIHREVASARVARDR